MNTVIINTDGGCAPNPGAGGWAAILVKGTHEKVVSGGSVDSTNQRMELTAFIEAIKCLNQSCEITLRADSKYVGDGVTKWLNGWVERGWRKANKKPVENVDLWQQVSALLKQGGHTVVFEHVKGHTGDAYNERCDALVRLEREKIISDIGKSEG